MSAIGPLRRWTSASIPHRQAVELDPLQFAGGALGDSIHGVAFVILGIDDLPLPVVAHAIESYRDMRNASRLCLAGRHESLSRIHEAGVGDRNVGLMLDGVAACTPLSALICERIEAVRFDSVFVSASSLDMRIGLVLKSMLALARELGLCTLGERVAVSGRRPVGRFEFDYVPPGFVANHPAVGAHCHTRPRR